MIKKFSLSFVLVALINLMILVSAGPGFGEIKKKILYPDSVFQTEVYLPPTGEKLAGDYFGQVLGIIFPAKNYFMYVPKSAENKSDNTLVLCVPGENELPAYTINVAKKICDRTGVILLVVNRYYLNVRAKTTNEWIAGILQDCSRYCSFNAKDIRFWNKAGESTFPDYIKDSSIFKITKKSYSDGLAKDFKNLVGYERVDGDIGPYYRRYRLGRGITQTSDGTVHELKLGEAKLTGDARYDSKSDSVKEWNGGDAAMTWSNINLPIAQYRLELDYSAGYRNSVIGGYINIIQNQYVIKQVHIKGTGGPENTATLDCGIIKKLTANNLNLSIKTGRKSKQPLMDVKKARLVEIKTTTTYYTQQLVNE